MNTYGLMVVAYFHEKDKKGLHKYYTGVGDHHCKVRLTVHVFILQGCVPPMCATAFFTVRCSPVTFKEGGWVRSEGHLQIKGFRV